MPACADTIEDIDEHDDRIEPLPAEAAAEAEPEPKAAEPPGSDDIRQLLARIARPHRSGGKVVERASVLSAGADFTAVMAWIEEHGGEAEAVAPRKAQRGLHSARLASGPGGDPTPLRFILPPGVLG
jgi:hypothetical protein